MIYSFFIFLFYAALRFSSIWNPKARAWLEGRVQWRSTLKAAFPVAKIGKQVWIHCASLGEFEQGRPIIEAIRSKWPDTKIILTFFSPSGYEVRKNYAEADFVCYLPLDTKKNARDFLDIIKPDLIIFVKYEYWRNFLKIINKRKIPFIQVSSIFRPNYIFFKWYGGMWRRSLKQMDKIFIQDQSSAALLQTIKIENFQITGDTRYDRVVSIRDQFSPIKEIEDFCRNKNVFIAGSTWEPDEQLLSKLVTSNPDLLFILAPHEIDEGHLTKMEELFPDSIRFSKYIEQRKTDAQVLIMDNIGMLSKLYHYACICYIGGGFGVGIHNTLEAAAFGKPVIFGPNYQKFTEAIELIEKGAGFSVKNEEELNSITADLLRDEEFREKASKTAYTMIKENSGATQKIMNYIQEKRLLTN